MASLRHDAGAGRITGRQGHRVTAAPPIPGLSPSGGFKLMVEDAAASA